LEFARFIGRRLILALIVLWGVVTIVFFISRVLPGNPVALLSGPVANPQTLHDTTIRLGLDKGVATQYGIYMRDLATGNLGTSFTTGRSVTSDILSRLPATLELIIPAFVISVLLSVGLAAVAAARPGGVIDVLVRGWTLAGVAIPTFWLGLLLLLLFWRTFHVVPSPTGQLGILTTPPPRVTGFYVIDALLAGDVAAFWDAVEHLILPVTCLVVVVSAPLARVLRASMVEVLDSDYLLGARALGIPTRTLLFKDALKNAVIPVLPVWASAFGYLIGGAVFVEAIYSWPGIGLYAVNAIGNSDYPAILGFVLVATVIYLLAFLAADILTHALDPRTRLT
jgi:ABC-type dipeptide/oligopeptide/nickel transport system permease component